ncbi:nucleus protein [Moniliophthora roreri MCA 2997]|uniref:Nucleus protein n=2 Tax=Moniliophthora roreri TaxID=221103 RepID=V2XHL8_MONRO|nr:nucleus protein [Moniliophthora roreri MCA 2997]KAI3613807.1 nucleus protein [Moniliophthora roreri]
MNFYFSAAQVLDRLDAKQGSIKGLIASLPEKDRKRTSALVIETLKYKPVLDDIIKEAKLLKEERKKLTSANLALVLVHDLLLSNGGIQAGDGPIKQAVLRHKTRLRAELQKIKIKRGAESNEALAHHGDSRASQIPRYVRVNTLLWSTEAAVEYFVSRGYRLSGPFEDSANNRGFTMDEHVPNLLLFNPQISFQDDPSYKAGKVILQDKASCFPAVVLDPPTTLNSAVIDATAAPGNKTSHLSALMGNNGKLYAFEKDKRRFSTLQMMLSKAKCGNIKALNTDFLTTDPLDPEYAAVTHILLDPSCSGSGIVNRLDYLLEQEGESDQEPGSRLQKLAGFQLLMIKHAMKFPNIRRIVYSTCSIHATENEHVVCAALKSDEALAKNFTLAPRNDVLPKWSRRGIPEEMDKPDLAESLVRCMPGEDATNGFFVSCFVRQVVAKSDDGNRKRKADSKDSDDMAVKAPQKKRKKKKGSKVLL